jgi:hypothetical protein
MNKAEAAIKKLGNSHLWIGEQLGLTRVTVWKWSKSGVIPMKYHDALIKMAREREVDLSYSDLRQDIK